MPHHVRARSASATCHSDESVPGSPSVWRVVVEKVEEDALGLHFHGHGASVSLPHPEPYRRRTGDLGRIDPARSASPAATSHELPAGSTNVSVSQRCGRAPHPEEHRQPEPWQILSMTQRERTSETVPNWKKDSMEKLAKLSWRARGSGGTCTAEVDLPIRGYGSIRRSRSNPFAAAGSEGSIPTVSWISFDGDIYWVRLSTSQGWPRTIRVTQGDVDGAKT